MKKVALILTIIAAIFLGITAERVLESSIDPADEPDYSKKEKIKARKKYFSPSDIVIKKELLYDDYTLEDEYSYGTTLRSFQWDKMQIMLAVMETAQDPSTRWGILQNRRNENGRAPLPRNFKESYGNYTDSYGVERYQAVPLYNINDSIAPDRYSRDGVLVKILSDTGNMCRVRPVYLENEWMLPARYVKPIQTPRFNHTIFVDRKNQNITTLELSEDEIWLVRSMNPATTGVNIPPYMRETPLGIFVVQEFKDRMDFLVDGTDQLGGFAPYASRFCCGAYIHGIPVNLPSTQQIEYSYSLGTTPRSHMCVRTATSHAFFIQEWARPEETLVFVIE